MLDTFVDTHTFHHDENFLHKVGVVSNLSKLSFLLLFQTYKTFAMQVFGL